MQLSLKEEASRLTPSPDQVDGVVSWPLSAAQQGVWVAQQLDPANPRYNCGGYLEIHGAVELAWLESAVRQALLETEALRVRFISSEDGVRQSIEAPPQQVLHVIDVSRESDPQLAADAWMKNDLARVADLSRAPLFNHAWLKLGSERSFFYLRYHHIVMDGFGQTRYWSRIAEIYSALASGAECAASAFGSLQDLLNEDGAYRSSPQFMRDRQYWQESFVDRPEPARLSGIAAIASRNLLRRTVDLAPADTERLRAAAQRSGSRWSVLVIAATAAYMQRLTGSENVVLGLPVTSRMTPVARDTPCMMANELPLRLRLPATISVADLLRQVSGQVGRVLLHQRYRGEDLHHALKLSGSEQKLVGPVVNVISFDHHVHFGAHRTTAHYLSSGPINDLLIGFYGKTDGSELQIFFDANPELYSADELVSHQQRFLHFLTSFLLAEADLPISRIDLLQPSEREQLARFNATERAYDLSRCLHDLIDQQAQRTPDAVAIAVAEGAMTYRELMETSDRLAAHLLQLGVAAGQRVGVFELRSLELVIDLLAIMKAGAAYVPLDPELPLARLEYQLENAEIAVVLSRSNLVERLAGCGVRTVAVDHALPLLPTLITLPLALPAVTPDSAAYVIYTSGSTGQPKGVAVPHKGVVNRLLWMQDAYRLEADDCVLQKTPFTFDVSVWEFFWPLMTGSRLFLAAPEAHRDPRYVARIIREQAITTLHFVPPMLDLFLAEPELAGLSSLRRVVCSGEALRPETVHTFFSIFKPETHNTELYNLYGPTEASIDVTAWRCRPHDAQGAIPIGYPVANTRIYLLDASGAPTPIGVPGEMFIGGVQVALGYVNRPELSRERFLPNPFAAGIMYRTGDLARYRADGAIEFLGRLDHQVKLRGFRIELGEIESALLLHPAVTQAVVTTWDRAAGDRRLVAYVVSSAGTEELPAFLAERLPEYMVPAHIVSLAALPLLLNGKIDRRALPLPLLAEVGTLLLPSTPAEQLLHTVWQQVLGNDQIGVEQSFFALGGDSMLSIRVRTGIERHGYTFSIEDLFRSPTIRSLAKHLQPLASAEQKHPASAPFDMLRAADRALLPAGLEDAYPLSAMQGGMLFHAEFDDETAVYRVVTSLQVAAQLDPGALQRAIADTFQRHPALRSSYDLSTYSEPLQLVHQTVEIPFEIADDLGGHDAEAAQRSIQAWVEHAKFHRFDVASAPLLRFTVHPRGARCFQLSVVEHHVVLDGWSDAAMLEEIVNRYRASLSGQDLALPQIPSNYRDFVAEERRVLADAGSRQYWSTLLQGAEPTLLPRMTLQHGAQRRTTQQAFEVALPDGVGAQLRQLAQREGLPLKALLATAHIAVLRLVCNASEVVTGVVSNGRLEQVGGDQVIGVFLNTLPLRVDTRSGSLLSIAHQVFAHERDGAAHRRYPFVQIQRDLGGQLQLDSYVNFMDFHLQWQSGKTGEAAVMDSIGVAETNIPLAANFLLDPVHNRLKFWLDCDISLLDPEFCQRLVGYYQRALDALAKQPDGDIAALDLLAADERRLLAGWNDTALSYDQSTTVHAQIARQVERSPDAAALAHRWNTLSYAELDRGANRLARQLRQLGVRRGSLVGVSLRRSADLVLALLAVMKAGGAYVPLDPNFPKNRLDFIAADAGINCLVTDSTGPAGLLADNVVLLDTDAALIAAQAADALAPDAAADAGGDDPAYVIYTSGSTGLPKGTVIRHRNVINFFAGMDERIGCTVDDVLLAVTSVSFDISVLELLWPLTRGAKVVVADERLIETLMGDDTADGEHGFAELCLRHRVSMMQSTPSFLAAVAAEAQALAALRGARAVLVGGEAFPVGLALQLVTALPGVRIFNMYGPTETTIWSTAHELDPQRDTQTNLIPIGRPIANTEILVLDPARRPLPVGVAGELWIGGAGVAGEYLGRPDLTAERFPPHPDGRGLMYRTGDRVRWRPDGLLEFLGRVDRQVKILGHRVEPDEIESVLSLHPQVASVAVVALQKASGSAELVAFVAPRATLLDRGAEQDHVRRWGEVWEGAYTDPASGAQAGDPERDFAGWLSSYDNAPIPLPEMREWLRHTVNRIDALRPRSVLDVGVGVGLFLREFAPRVERYLGLDVSEAALRNAAASLAVGPQLPEHISLVHGDAGHLEQLASGSADTVLLNSVIQYFPGTLYLQRVLREAARVVGAHGAVFVGDVRDLDLLEAFHATAQLHRAPALMPAREIAAVLKRQLAAEGELCLSTAFFRELAADIDSLGTPRLELKRGHAENELSCFRFDAVLLGSERSEPAVAGELLAWSALPADWAKALAARLLALPAMVGLTISGIPNQRLVRPLKLVQLLREADAAATAWDLEKALWEADDGSAVDPEAVAELGEQLGCRVRLLVPAHGRLHEFDAVFERVDDKLMEQTL
ncbi:amino acid adenylation domain-containing protein [Paraherbaspirillum soli]|uniref:Amino acid adenylation domain-containing protein n=1 Tax=Paraherbaspirillum soli TaxID=631222 RepID=A0ABW0MCD2_9BURK